MPYKDREARNACSRRSYARHWTKERRDAYYALNAARILAKKIAWYAMNCEARIGRPKPAICEACGKSAKRLYADHNHETGVFRGWLCLTCNSALGYLLENIELIRKMQAYLKQTAKHAS